ncbi:MAG: hypothetical protein R3E90_03885 [Marinicella sp.]|nr:hypothetical protein [Xanthomonadales bacterium]
MKKIVFVICSIITSTFVEAQQLGSPTCDSLLLVSSWGKDNVKIFDGCDGHYIKDLAQPGVLDGPQAIFEDANGDVIIVSESNHKLIKFDRETLSEATTVLAPTVMSNPITVVKKDPNHIYLGSYSENRIVELNTENWQITKTLLPANNNQIRGIDIGMALGADGQLYVPGYDSDSILKVNPSNNATSQFVQSGNNNLDRPRSIIFSNNRILVSAWGNQAIYSYSLNGQFQGEVVSSFQGVAGLVNDGPDHFLATSDTLNTIRRYNSNDFSFETIVPNRSGGLAGATFVYRLEKVLTTTPVNNLKQAWLIGVGQIDGNSIHVPEVYITENGAFGENFNPDTINNSLWGTLNIVFNSCHHAQMMYESNIISNEGAFGSGGYPLQRLVMNAAGLLCDASDFENMSEKSFFSGTFFGGAQRDGEGFNIDYLNENQVIVTWFTYLPAE